MPTIDECRTLLGGFLDRNPTAQLAKIRNAETDEERVGITRPWDDSSIQILMPDDPGELVSALNAVFLPLRLSAIYHVDLRQLEVAWSAFPIRPSASDVDGRRFVFKFNNIDYQCRFGESSERLITIASETQITSQSDTNFRNLFSFQMYGKIRQQIKGQNLPLPLQFLDKARSFWISNVDYDEDATITMLDSLNFYLSYYDEYSPIVLMHSARLGTAHPQKIRYAHGSFPKTIIARPLDSNLLHYWRAGADGDPIRRFIYYFRLIEYAASTYVEAQKIVI